MTDHETRQAQLLDAYLDTLLDDPTAPPPPDLDPEMVAFAQQVTASKQVVDVPLPRWEETLFQAQAGKNRHAFFPTETERETPPMTTYNPGRITPSLKLPLTLVAAITAVLAFGLLLATTGFGNGRNPNPNPGAGAVPVLQNATATFTATATHTATPTFVPTATHTIDPTGLSTLGDITPTTQAMGGGGVAIEAESLTFDDSFGPPLEVILQEIPPVEIEFGEVYFADLDPNAPFATFSYNAPEDLIFLSLIETGGLPATHQISIQSAPTITVFGGGGGGGGGGGPVDGPLMFMLNEGDDFQVVIGSAVGVGPSIDPNYAISFFEVEPELMQAGEPISGQITDEQPFAVYSLPTEAGATYTLQVEGADGLDTSLQLMGNEGGLFGVDEDGGPGFDPEIYQQTATQSGETIVLVYPHFEGDTGAFTLNVEAEPAPSITDGTQTVRLGGKQSAQVVRAVGEPGTTGTVTVRPVDGEASLWVEVSDGEQQIAFSTTENASQLSRDFTFPESGEVYIRLSANLAFGPFPSITEVVEVSLE